MDVRLPSIQVNMFATGATRTDINLGKRQKAGWSTDYLAKVLGLSTWSFMQPHWLVWLRSGEDVGVGQQGARLVFARQQWFSV